MRVSQAAVNTLVKSVGSSFGTDFLQEILPNGNIEKNGNYISDEFVIQPISGFTTWKTSGKKTCANYIYLVSELFNCDVSSSYDFLSLKLLNYEIYLQQNRSSRPHTSGVDPLGGFKPGDVDPKNSMIFYDSENKPFMARVRHGRSDLWAVWADDCWNYKMKPEKPYPIQIFNDDPKGDIVIIVQTVRAANHLRDMGYTVATWGGPERAKTKDVDWTSLRGRELIFWPNNNLPCVENFSKVLKTVCNPHEKSSILDVSDLQPGVDAVDSGFSSSYLMDLFISNNRMPLIKPDVSRLGGLDPGEVASLGNTVASWGCSMNQFGVAKNSADNVFKILRNDPFLKNKIKFNEIKKTFVTKVNLTKKTDKKEKSEIFFDSMRKYVLCYFQAYYNPSFSMSSVDVGLSLFGEQEDIMINPIKDSILNTVWDGRKRLQEFFFDYSYFPRESDNPEFYKHPDHIGMQAYLPFVGEKIFCSLVRRLFEPGSYLDNIIIFFGKQGQGKSKFLDIISYGNIVVIANSISKDINRCYELLNQAWVVDFPDMAAFEKTSEDVKKAVFSSQTDSYRGAYGRSVTENKRTCVLFSSTNKDYWLRDSTGARRYVIIDLKALDGNESQMMFKFNKIKRDLSQLYAEAYHLYSEWVKVRDSADNMPPWEAYFFPASLGEETMGFRYLKKLRAGGYSGSSNEDMWVERIISGFEGKGFNEGIVSLGDLYSFVDYEKSFVRAPRNFSNWAKDFMSIHGVKYKTFRDGGVFRKGFFVNFHKLKESLYGLSH